MKNDDYDGLEIGFQDGVCVRGPLAWGLLVILSPFLLFLAIVFLPIIVHSRRIWKKLKPGEEARVVVMGVNTTIRRRE